GTWCRAWGRAWRWARRRAGRRTWCRARRRRRRSGATTGHDELDIVDVDGRLRRPADRPDNDIVQRLVDRVEIGERDGVDRPLADDRVAAIRGERQRAGQVIPTGVAQ